MKLTEVSEIEIKTFSVEDIRNISSKDFDRHNLPDNLKLLPNIPENFSWKNDAIGLGDAFQRAVNELFNGKGEVALIVEKRVLTLHQE